MEKASNNEIKGKQLNAGNGFCSAHLAKYENKKFAVKNGREINNHFEKKALDSISGPSYSYMVKRLTRLTPEQCVCTADPHYVAEECHSRQYVEVSTVREYTDGKPFADISENNVEEVKDCIIKLHNIGLAPNDIHSGDFIRTSSGELKTIDSSYKGIMRTCQVSDILTFRNEYNIDIQGHGFVYNLILLEEELRRLSRKIRGKQEVARY